MKARQKMRTTPKNNKHPYSCSHFQFHLNDQDPETLKAKIQLEEFSSALDNYDHKQSTSHLRLFTMHNEVIKNQSWKSATQKKLFQSQNLQKQRKQRERRITHSSNTCGQSYRKKKNIKQRQNLANSKEIRINLSFNNILPDQEISQIKINQINKIIKKTRPTSEKKDNFKKLMNFQVDKETDGRIHSHSNLNIVQKLKSNFLSTSIYQFSHQKPLKQPKKNVQQKGRQFHHRVSSEQLSIVSNSSREKQNCHQKTERDLQLCPPFLIQNYSSCNLKKMQQQNKTKIGKASRLGQYQAHQLFKEDSQLKQDFQQLKQMLKVQNQNVLSGKFRRNLMAKYTKRQFKHQKVQSKNRLADF